MEVDVVVLDEDVLEVDKEDPYVCSDLTDLGESSAPDSDFYAGSDYDARKR